MKGVSRRGFLVGSASLLVASAFRPERLEAGVLDRFFGRPAKLPSPITPTGEFYLTSIGSTPKVKIEDWSLRVTGLVRNPITLRYDDLLKRTNTSLISTLECIGNPIGGDSISTAKWEGVKLNAILDEAGVNPNAVDLVLRGADGYSDSFPAKRALQEEVLLVTKMNGGLLPPEHGFPARVIIPGIYGMKNVKWLTELELADHDYQGYWEKRGWSDEAIVKVRSRIDLPGDGDTIMGREYVIRGIAFGGLYGIRKVEVSTDGGATFREAQLEPPLSPYSWVFWSFPWTVPAVSRYTLVVRAMDTRGVRQQAESHSSYPDGSSGLHEVTVAVAT
ncbi:MAG: molybdopterin-dependent oxidoreductase [Nitrospirae bacterium]|nr:molybdopterin-dependent oxidoreductase [Nitrospirota bacterium]